MAMTLGVRRATRVDRSFDSFELRRLDWDTNHFGQKMGVLAVVPAAIGRRSNALAADLRLSLAEAADVGYAHVILRVAAEQLGIARVAEECGLRLVDIGVDLSIKLSGRRALATLASSVRPAAPDDLAALRAISEDAFEHSRFAADPFFSMEQVAGFYQQWITNLCDGLADVVFVAEANGEVAGFTSCVRQADGTGRIPLIATSEDYRRQGVGRCLIEASIHWFVSSHIGTAFVKTQVANYPALALYTQAGFRVAKGELTYSAMPHRPAAAG